MNKQQALEKLLQRSDQSLLEQIKKLDLLTFLRQQQLLLNPSPSFFKSIEPITDSAAAGNPALHTKGKEAIKQGLTGAILIAGGQGTRLGFDGPKGCFPVSVVKKKSLFQLFAEKTLAAGVQAGRQLPLAIMTSPLNHHETVSFFQTNDYFGLANSQVSFFCQDLLPFLDDNGNLVLDPAGKIAQGPDGNGFCLRKFFTSGIWDQWHADGVRVVNTILVDNPLADPFDAELLGYHLQENTDIVIKCTTRENLAEKVGLIVKHQGQIEIVEYTEVPADIRQTLDAQGKPLYRLANLSLFSFSMEFIRSIASKDLPLHHVKKAVPTKEDPSPTQPNVWKFESYIFDLLQYTHKIKTLSYDREVCFSPLKNKSGENSLTTVQQALLERERKIMWHLSGIEPPRRRFELSQQFYYPTEEIKSFWKNKAFPNSSYIE